MTNNMDKEGKTTKRPIMDKKICPEHRQVVAKVVSSLRHDCRLPEEVYQFLVNHYGTEEIQLTNMLRRSMNSADLITKQDKRYPNKCNSRS